MIYLLNLFNFIFIIKVLFKYSFVNNIYFLFIFIHFREYYNHIAAHTDKFRQPRLRRNGSAPFGFILTLISVKDSDIQRHSAKLFSLFFPDVTLIRPHSALSASLTKESNHLSAPQYCLNLFQIRSAGLI
jgi:hypothetical protein